MLQALTAATPTPWRAWGAFPLTVGGEARLLLPDEEAGRLVIAEAQPGLPPWAAAPLPPPLIWGHSLPMPLQDSQVLVGLSDGRRGVADLGCSQAGRLCLEVGEVGDRWPILHAAALDGGVVLGLGPPDRDALWWGADGARSLAADVRAAGSDVNAVVAADLDGDGGPELVVGLGAWSAYDVRVLARQGGRWATRSRLRLGHVGALTVVDGQDGPLILAAKSDLYPSRVVWDADRPYGEPAGVYALAERGGELEVRDRWPLPSPRMHAHRILVGDFDGDGLQDVAVDLRGEEQGALLLRGLPDGARAAAYLHGVVPMAAVDLDGDGDDELIVRLPDDAHRTWVLGTGTHRVPRRAEADLRIPPLHDPSPQAQRALTLARAGLPGEAARLIRRLARGQRGPEAAELEAWAGEVLLATGQVSDAAAAFASSAEASDDRRRAARAADLWRRVHDPVAELRVREALAGPKQGDEAMEALGARAAGVRWSAGKEVGAGWEITQPVAVSLRPMGTLSLDLLGGAGPALRHAADWDGRFLRVEVEADLDLLEYHAGLGLVVEQGGEVLLAASVASRGGGGLAALVLQCDGAAWPRAVASTGPAMEVGVPVGRARIRASLDRGTGTVRCGGELVRPSGERVVFREQIQPLTEVTTPGPVTVEIGSGGARGRTLARVASLDVLGVRPATSAGPAAPRLLAQGRPDAARALVPGDSALAVAADVRAGRAPDPAGIPSSGRLPPELATLLRQDPVRVVEVLRPVRGERVGRDLLEATEALRKHRYAAGRPILTHPALERIDLDSEALRLACVELIEAWLALGAAELAERGARRLLAHPQADPELRVRAALSLSRVAAARGDRAEAAAWIEALRRDTSDRLLVEAAVRALGLDELDRGPGGDGPSAADAPRSAPRPR